MAQPSLPAAAAPPLKCIYNVPLPSDQPPLRAKNRIIGFVNDVREHVVGPMPVRAFIDEFLYLENLPYTGVLSRRFAFQSVPSQADTPSGIYEPLVRSTPPFRHGVRSSVPLDWCVK